MGHAPLNVTRPYGQPTLVDVVEALKRFARYRICGESAHIEPKQAVKEGVRSPVRRA